MAKAPAKLKCRIIKDPGLLNIQFVIDNRWIQLTCKKERNNNRTKTKPVTVYFSSQKYIFKICTCRSYNFNEIKDHIEALSWMFNTLL